MPSSWAPTKFIRKCDDFKADGTHMSRRFIVRRQQYFEYNLNDEYLDLKN